MDKIQMNYFTKSNGKTHKGELRTSIFAKGSGVKVLLDLDPTSKVEIHKSNGDIISYNYVL